MLSQNWKTVYQRRLDLVIQAPFLLNTLVLVGVDSPNSEVYTQVCVGINQCLFKNGIVAAVVCTTSITHEDLRPEGPSLFSWGKEPEEVRLTSTGQRRSLSCSRVDSPRGPDATHLGFAPL